MFNLLVLENKYNGLLLDKENNYKERIVGGKFFAGEPQFRVTLESSGVLLAGART